MAFNRGSVNKVMLVGRCGADPETRSLPSGDSVSNVSLATTSAWRDRQTSETKERTEWHRVAFFGRTSEAVSKYVRKGSLLYVEGSLRTREWEKDGVKRYTTEVLADTMTMLGSKNGGMNSNAGAGASANGARGAPSEPRAPTGGAGGVGGAGAGAPPQNKPSADDFEDDIPF